MAGSATEETKKDFKLELQLREATVKLEIPVTIPFSEKQVPELTQLILTSFDLPIFVEKGEVKHLANTFVQASPQNVFNSYTFFHSLNFRN
jgi:hypothetical protein